ncbi:DUF924 family protein [Falsiroseomonas sp.]|uniref:DUF924 family protein n=1 Tax=Falsiroseomonas sp. TaxID=2870721 RepID=UPI003F7026F7
MTQPQSILAFWFSEGPDTFRKAWFLKDETFDASIRTAFGDLLVPARTGALDTWAETPDGALALLLVLDQFPRNLHRGSPEAFASDEHGRAIARQAVLTRRFDLAVTPTQRSFFYLPFEHSEAPADQDLAVALFEGLRDFPAMAAPDSVIDYAWRHRTVIQRFGRFPHRNTPLGRPSTPAELAWLAAGGGF